MARTRTTFSDPNLLEAALEGLLLQKQRIEMQIQEVRAMLGRRGSSPAKSTGTPAASSSAAPRKRELSDAARKRIAAAQKKRWAEYRKKQTRGE